MISLALDFETEGLLKDQHEVIEVGAILWSTGFNRVLEAVSFFVQPQNTITEEITNLTHITDPMVRKFGYSSAEGLDILQGLMEQTDIVIGQNVVRFDYGFYEKWCQREGQNVVGRVWCDTRTDLPRTVESKSLSYMAADHGFLNPFPHSALADCYTVLRLASQYNYDDIVARAKEPNVVLRARVGFDRNKLAKQRKFIWKPDPLKMWLKVVKQCDVQYEVAEAEKLGFDLDVPEGVTVEQVWYDN